MGRLQFHGVEAEHCVFVGESRSERSVATLAGMKSAPHPLLAEAVLVGETPFLQIGMPVPQGSALGTPCRTCLWCRSAEKIRWHRPEYRFSTKDCIRVKAAGFYVHVLSDDAVRGDLYLLRDAGDLDQDAEFVEESKGWLRRPPSASGLLSPCRPTRISRHFISAKATGITINSWLILR